jgi:cytochrome c
MRSALSILVAIATIPCLEAVAQTGPSSGLGTRPSDEEIRKVDTAVGPSGKGLPAGSGSATQGGKIFLGRGCAWCHGPTGSEGPAPQLVEKGVPQGGLRGWPYATSIWDFINRAMPQGQEGRLTADEVYALTAYLLYENGVIEESFVLDANTLPKVQMPGRSRFFSPPEWKPPAPANTTPSN